jgi:hypothetical protein
MPLSGLPHAFRGISRLVVAFLDVWLTTKTTQPTLASQKPTSNHDTGSRISQVSPEDSSRLHETSVSKHFPSPILHRPLHCDDLRLYSSSPVNTPAVSAMGVYHNGRATEVDLSFGTQRISTGFDDQSLLLKTGSKSDATTLLQDVISKITILSM